MGADDVPEGDGVGDEEAVAREGVAEADGRESVGVDVSRRVVLVVRRRLCDTVGVSRVV